MNLIRSGTLVPASSAHDGRALVNIYHLHPLAAGPLEAWPLVFARIAAMGFSHAAVGAMVSSSYHADEQAHAAGVGV